MEHSKPNLQQNPNSIKSKKQVLNDLPPKEIGNTHYSKGSVKRRINE
ncbi:hypothetical protein V6C27_03180 [Peptococcaceae bacterium 1198_IL3148]